MDTLIGDKGAKRAGTSRRQKALGGGEKKPRADYSPFKRNDDAATKQINFRLIRLTSGSGVRRSTIWHYRRRPFRAQFRECSFILDVAERDGEASLCWDQSAASTSSSAPKQVTFCWTPVDVLLGAAAHCKAPDHLGTKNSINYLEIRMDVFLFPPSLCLSLVLSVAGASWGSSRAKFIFFISCTQRGKHYFPRLLQLPFFLFCFFACGAGDSLASQASALVGIQEKIEELPPRGSLINRHILRTLCFICV